MQFYHQYLYLKSWFTGKDKDWNTRVLMVFICNELISQQL